MKKLIVLFCLFTNVAFSQIYDEKGNKLFYLAGDELFSTNYNSYVGRIHTSNGISIFYSQKNNEYGILKDTMYYTNSIFNRFDYTGFIASDYIFIRTKKEMIKICEIKGNKIYMTFLPVYYEFKNIDKNIAATIIFFIDF